jgi:drug/metabolite transporter (DMT)-like permease
MKLWAWFVLGTILCWGAYVPAIHAGQRAIGGRAPGLWAFLLVGAAYVLVAVLAPLGLLAWQRELGQPPSARGAGIALLAGALGALGALFVILALRSGGTPLTVPPLVFAGAPVVATLIALLLHPPARAPTWPFFVGIALAAVGAALVLRFKPA